MYVKQDNQQNVNFLKQVIVGPKKGRLDD